jgi:hypothetical protein
LAILFRLALILHSIAECIGENTMRKASSSSSGATGLWFSVVLGALLLLPAAQAAEIVISVEDQDLQPVSGFRYLVEEDQTFKPVPGNQDLGSLSFDFHRSHAPVAVAIDGSGIKGSTQTATATIQVSIMLLKKKREVLQLLLLILSMRQRIDTMHTLTVQVTPTMLKT